MLNTGLPRNCGARRPVAGQFSSVKCEIGRNLSRQLTLGKSKQQKIRVTLSTLSNGPSISYQLANGDFFYKSYASNWGSPLTCAQNGEKSSRLNGFNHVISRFLAKAQSIPKKQSNLKWDCENHISGKLQNRWRPARACCHKTPANRFLILFLITWFEICQIGSKGLMLLMRMEIRRETNEGFITFFRSKLESIIKARYLFPL